MACQEGGRVPTSGRALRASLLGLAWGLCIALLCTPVLGAGLPTAPPNAHESEVAPKRVHEEATRLPSAIPLKRDDPAVERDWGGAPSWGLLALILPIVYFSRRWLWRVAGRSNSTAGRPHAWSRLLGRNVAVGMPADLQVLTSRKITSNHSLHVVSWQGHRLLLGCSEGSITVLSSGTAQGVAVDTGSQEADAR